jgi:hypothetical protein
MKRMSSAEIDAKVIEQDAKNVRTLPLGGLLIFAGLSAADLILTWILLSQSGGKIKEGNPIADAWLAAYGWAGLIVYKILGLLLVAAVVIFISRRQPKTGKRLLGVAICALVVVTLYSYYLLANMF